ncbi:Uncharacterised protein [Raoultella ornithinolytica]|nr:Uncharacterised protein [Raoultella ornithinolytica]
MLFYPLSMEYTRFYQYAYKYEHQNNHVEPELDLLAELQSDSCQ